MKSVKFRLAPDKSHVEFWHECIGVESLADKTPNLHAAQKAKFRRISLTDDKSWFLVKSEPLTIFPPIQCRICGLHGRITKGKWVPS